jgi:Na+-translocating ferredoxin:NAD+ oxidoreductase RNF subunit RnfB
MDIILPIVFFVSAGLAVAIILTIASKVFEVKTDETVSNILACLPGINCGACGFSGCEGYATAVAEGKTAPNLCKPGGEGAANGIGKVLGIEVTVGQRETAVVFCQGNHENAPDKYEYDGTPSCRAVNKYYGGSKLCAWGCDGLGDCVKVCDYGAISIINNVAVIDRNKCQACGKCIKICPQKIIGLVRADSQTLVLCSSSSSGKETRSACKVGCIACKICERNCPEKAIIIETNKAVINHDKCKNCGECINKCPQKCILSA